MIRVGSMCSGYGGLEMSVAAALAPAQVATAWHCEVDPAAVETLEKHYPGTPNLGDLRTVDWSRVEPVVVVAMGVPCQAVSAAGRQLVEDDPRWLWPAALVGLVALRPPIVVFENVRNLISIRRGEVWRGILDDMRTAGYAVRWCTFGACAVDAPHHRHRVFALGAYVGRRDASPAVRVAVDECGARRGVLLASPLARDGEGRNEGDAAYWERKRARGFNGGIPLGAQVGLLPSGEWGPYAAAVERWEGIIGRPAPEPTEAGSRGGNRLAAALPEWMMGLPVGHLTGHLERRDALRLAGNGVCPQQGAAAIDILLTPGGGETS